MAFDFPSSPVVGQVSNGYVWNGQAWAGNGNLSPVAPPSDTPPGNPVNGQLWWETDSGDLYLWYTDANSSQWVQISGPGLGDAPSDGNMYVRQSGVWASIFGMFPPMPTNTAGVGQWRSIQSSVGGALVLPSGGTWAWLAAAFTNTYVWAFGVQAGVSAGGSTVGTATANATWTGAAWRIA